MIRDGANFMGPSLAFTKTFVALIDRLPQRLPSARPEAPIYDICSDQDEWGIWPRAADDRARYRTTTLARGFVVA